MKKLLETFLAELRWYRKWKGGTWYKVYDRFGDYGMAGDTYHWTRKIPEPGIGEIVEVEKYQYKNARPRSEY